MNNRRIIAALLSTSAIALAVPWAHAADTPDQSSFQPGSIASDAAINGRVSAVLMSDPALDGARIRVDTHEGVVSLVGTVEAIAAGLRAVELASGVEGVARVESTLKLAAR